MTTRHYIYACAVYGPEQATVVELQHLKPAKLPHWSMGKVTLMVGSPVIESGSAHGMTRRMGRCSPACGGSPTAATAAAADTAASASDLLFSRSCKAGLSTGFDRICRRCHRSST